MGFDPAGTSWSVDLFSNDSMGGVPARQVWHFRQDGIVTADTEWSGRYERRPDSDSAYDCKVPTATGAPGDAFIIYFMTPDLFVAIKNDSVYRFGKRIDPIIDVMIVIDTISLTQNGNGEGSTNETPARCDAAWAFMLTDSDHTIAGNGTANLRIMARPRMRLRVATTSVGNQLDAAVFVYDFGHRGGDHVLDTAGMKSGTYTRLAVVPAPTQADHLPPNVIFQDGSFYVAQIDVSNPGTEYLDVKFVVYGPPARATRPVLGYFQWDASITVTGGESPAEG